MFARSLIVYTGRESLGLSIRLNSFRLFSFHRTHTYRSLHSFFSILMKSRMKTTTGGTGAVKKRHASRQGSKDVLGRPSQGLDRRSTRLRADIYDGYGGAKHLKSDVDVKVEDGGHEGLLSDATAIQMHLDGYLPLMRPSHSHDPHVPPYVQVDEFELTLEFTMNIGQSFRWRSIDPEKDSTYVGVLGTTVVALKHDDGPLGVSHVWYKVLGPCVAKETKSFDLRDQLEDYFNLKEVHLAELSQDWAARDSLYKSIVQDIPGARMLRQDPVECLFSFICSQNNHISRIHGMVNRMAQMYGTKIDVDQDAPEIIRYKEMYGADSEFYAFPDIEALQDACEEDLRNAGFGYRAKFIEASAKMLHTMPGGGKPWLLRLRDATFEESIDELCLLPGVGPKVAACVALFSLDKHSSIPVDTHVWQFSLRHYTPHLRGKTNSPKYHPEIQAAFIKRFGDYAGWAHNTLFISELSSIQKKLFEREEKAKEELESHTPLKYDTR